MTTGFDARKIARSCRSGAIATTDRNDATPYVSFCAYATDYRAQPIFLFSDLADHTQNLAQNAKVSLLCEQASHLSNPQAGPRVTLVGEVEKISDEQVCSLFLQQHASAKKYADFGDFNFYRLNVEKAHFVGGFGRAVWLDSKDYMSDSAASLCFLVEQAEMVSALNEDFPDFARMCAIKLLKLRGKNWQLLRIDGDGVDLKLASKIVRYPFETEMKKLSDVMDFAAKICR
ncbi:MAG: pyridoxamine 5'-phosphate oxidase family protein [Methylocystaceae bacterium]|nr:pyridoxamine 5'-phosphate oxidase family protein [Methylocystaceae bacterium]